MNALGAQLSGRRRLFLAAAAIAVAALLLPAGSPAPAAPGPSAAASASGAVAIRGFAFHPGTLRVARGTRVVFSNSSSVAHTATGRHRAFDAGVIKPGHSATVLFNHRGVFDYYCRIHPFMHGTIVVH